MQDNRAVFVQNPHGKHRFICRGKLHVFVFCNLSISFNLSFNIKAGARIVRYAESSGSIEPRNAPLGHDLQFLLPSQIPTHWRVDKG